MTFRHPNPRPPRLGPFLDQLREVLADLSRDRLTQCLLDHARTLPANQRKPFLEFFTIEGEDSPGDKTLLPDIEALIEELQEGEFIDGWGWDHEIYDERPWGDESWAPRMDALFERAGQSFAVGDFERAAEAYRRLFEAFELDTHDGGPMFSGALSPPDMLDIDLVEVQARLARSVYETAEPSRRAAALLRVVEPTVWYIDREVGLLRAMEDARDGPLPELESFLPDWISVLEGAEHPGSDWDSWESRRRALLREATIRHGGIEAIAALARRSKDLDAYLDWSRHEAQEGNLLEAVVALGEALEGLSKPAQRADVADRLATFAALTDQQELALCSRRLAWRLAPTAWRLRSLAQTALEVSPDPAEGFAGLMKEELQDQRSGELQPNEACAGLVEVFARDLEAAAQRLAKASSVGWSDAGHPGRWLFPVLLLAGAGAHEPPVHTILEELWQGLDGIHRGYAFDLLAQDAASSWVGEAVGVQPPEPSSLGDLAAMAVTLTMPEKEERQELLDACRTVTLARARHIVSNQFRRAYDHAAAVATACAEAFILAGAPEDGRGLLEQLQDEFPRHSSFRKSLRNHEDESAILS